ncbi:MAG TPA: hypothetical protein VD794_03775, partial [Flavisolibacter sp.]|nr:hypothetical protein [Flavisolibacter sp.]
NFYYYLFTCTPVAILLTLFGTIKKQHDIIRKVLIVVLTVTATVLCFMYLFSNMFTLGFGAWSTFNITYEHRKHPERQIREQRYDAGAFGYGGDRVVEVRPFAGLFWKVLPVDTTTIDKATWRRIDKEGDVKFP